MKSEREPLCRVKVRVSVGDSPDSRNPWRCKAGGGLLASSRPPKVMMSCSSVGSSSLKGVSAWSGGMVGQTPLNN